jgi:drug/metabolite transporter (DMT)-like permease
MPAQLSTRRAVLIGAACALAVVAIWTSFILIARASAARSLLPFDIAWLRFAFAGVIALPVLAWRGHERFVAGLGGTPRTALARCAALSATAGLGYCGFAYSAFFFAPAAHGAVLMPGCLPLWTALLAVLVLHEKLAPWRVVGLGLIATGALLVGGQSLWLALAGQGGVWRGDVLFLLGSLCWASYGVLCRRWRVGALDATLAIALGCLATAVPAHLLGIALGVMPSTLFAAPVGEWLWQAVYQGGLAMWVAGIAYTQVIATFGPVRATMLTSLVPPLAALGAVPLLGEPLSAAALAGLACVTAGLLIGLRAQGAPVAARDELRARSA